jgi:hypothetical protein
MEMKQFREFASAVVRQLPEDLHSVIAQRWIDRQGELAEALRKALLPATSFVRDMTKEGWTLVEDVQQSLSTVNRPEFVSCFNDEPHISGLEMQRRARAMSANLGQHDAEWMLRHQDSIPQEERGHYPVLPGTVWLNSRGHLCVPYLFYDAGRWFMDFGLLVRDWGLSVRLVRPRK